MLAKYKKYEKQYVQQSFLKIQIGGVISSFNKMEIINSEMPQLQRDFCELIGELELIKNEGRHNMGILFINDEGKELFLKFHDGSLLNDFKVGYFLSRLKPIYPHFIDVYGYTKCYKNSRYMDVLIAERGTETLWQYLSRNTESYIKSNLPDYDEIILQLDSFYDETIAEIGDVATTISTLEITRYDTPDDITTKQKFKEVYESKIKPIYDTKIAPFFLKFNAEFVNTFIKNILVIWQNFLIIDMITMYYYGTFIADKKYDNFMIKTVPYNVDTGNYVSIDFNKHDAPSDLRKIQRIVNTVTWDGIHYEHIYVYPVDFGSSSIEITEKMKDNPDDLSMRNFSDVNPKIISDFIHNSMQMLAYSDSKNHILRKSEENNINVQFTKQKTELMHLVQSKYYPFKIKIPNYTNLLSNLYFDKLLNINDSTLNSWSSVFSFVCIIKNSLQIGIFEESNQMWRDYRSSPIKMYDWTYGKEPVLKINLPV